MCAGCEPSRIADWNRGESEIKDVMRRTEMVPEQQAFDFILGMDSVQKVYHSEDLKEGATAFSEGRKPEWKGR